MLKKTVAWLALLCVFVSLVGCSYDKGRIAYNIKLSEFEKSMDIPNYKGIKVDKKSAEFSKIYGEIIESDVNEHGFISKKTEGNVAKDDEIFIDYHAEIDNQSFSKAKADNLKWKVGSTPLFIDGCKIEGFDEALIGAKIGEEFEIVLKIPGSYPDSAVAGKEATFKINVRYVNTDESMAPEEYYSKLGYKTYEDYVKNVERRAVETYLLEYVVDKFKINKYPKKEEERLFEDFGGYYDSDSAQVQQTLEMFGETAEDFDASVYEYLIHPFMDAQMPIYYIFDKEGLSYSDVELQEKTDELTKRYEKFGITKDDLTTQYGKNYFEYSLIEQKVKEYLYKHAKITN